tara:strand:+ start:1920 stop:3140 length:1221 start_codon:yes stop_codon:yes gene_type:complete
MIRDYFTIIIRRLFHRKLRSWLTMLGIFIGVAAVVSLISLGEGLESAVADQFSVLGSDKLFVEPEGVTGPPGSGTASNKLTDDDVDVVSNSKGVSVASGFVAKTGKVEFKNEIAFQFVYGIDVSGDEGHLVSETFGQELLIGRDLRGSDKNKVIVGFNYYDGKIFDRDVGLRDTLIIEGEEFKVVGVNGKIGNPFDDGAVIMVKDVVRELYGTRDEVDQIMAQVEPGFDVNVVASEVEKDLRGSRGVKEGSEDFQVSTPEQILESFGTVLGIVQAVLVGIAAISLVVGGIGIMNTMYTSVLERTREIGIMKSIGASQKDILTLFLLESGLLGMVGGLVGVLIGVGIGELVSYVARESLGSDLLQAQFGASLIIGALLFSFIIGMLSGFFPALAASKKQPVEALRYE